MTQTVNGVSNLLKSQTFTPGTTQVVAIGATSAATTNAVNAATTKVVVTLIDNDGWVAFGSTPTAAVATAGSEPLAAGVPRTYNVTGGVTKVAVIGGSSTATAGGYLCVAEFS